MKNWQLILAVILLTLAFVGGCYCGRSKTPEIVGIDTIPHRPDTVDRWHDTTIYHTQFIPVPIGKVDTFRVKVPFPVNVPDSSCQKSYNELYAAYTTMVRQDDGFEIKDDSGHLAGFGYVTDTLAANQIIGRKITASVRSRTISHDTTFIKTVERLKLKGLFGGGIVTNFRNTPAFWLNGGIKLKNDNIILVGGSLRQGQPIYEFKFVKAL